MSVGAAAGAFLVGAVALAGCQTLDFGRDPVPKEGNGSVMDPAEARIAEAVTHAERSLAVLAEARAAAVDLRVPDMPGNVPPELLQRASMDYIGPLEELARQLAAAAGYALVTAGRPPPAPVLVEIEAKDAPLIHIFRDAGMQAADRALLTVDAGRMTVRLDWFDEPRSAGPGG